MTTSGLLVAAELNLNFLGLRFKNKTLGGTGPNFPGVHKT